MKKDLCWGLVFVLVAAVYGFILGTLVPRAIDIEVDSRAASTREARLLASEVRP